jgi:hypothetical protein
MHLAEIQKRLPPQSQVAKALDHGWFFAAPRGDGWRQMKRRCWRTFKFFTIRGYYDGRVTNDRV